MSTHFRIARALPRYVAPPPPSGITLSATGAIFQQSTAGNSFAIPYPGSGIQAGDVIVMFVRATGPNASQTGWTTIASINNSNTAHIWIGYQVATGSEAGTTYSFTTTSNTNAMGQMLVFRGVDQTTPIDVTASTTNAQGPTTTTTPIPSVTTTKTGVALIYAAGDNSNTNTASTPSSPTGFTETLDTQAVGGPSGAMGYLIWSGSGATGTVTVTWSGAGRNTGVLMALRPA